MLEAGDGAAALRLLSNHDIARSIAFVFLDLCMPELDGFSTIAQLRHLESQKGREPLPVVGFTSEDAVPGTELHSKCLECGMNDVVVSVCV